MMREATVMGCLCIHPLLEATKTFRDCGVVTFSKNCSKITISKSSCSMEGRDPSTVLFSHSGIVNWSTEYLVDWECLGKAAESYQTCLGQLLLVGCPHLHWSHSHMM